MFFQMVLHWLPFHVSVQTGAQNVLCHHLQQAKNQKIPLKILWNAEIQGHPHGNQDASKMNLARRRACRNEDAFPACVFLSCGSGSGGPLLWQPSRWQLVFLGNASLQLMQLQVCAGHSCLHMFAERKMCWTGDCDVRAWSPSVNDRKSVRWVGAMMWCAMIDKRMKDLPILPKSGRKK